MGLIAVSINDSDVMRLRAQFEKIASQIPLALARGLNEGGDRVRTVVQRQLRDQAQPKRYSSITSRVRTMRAYDAAAPKSGIGPIGGGSLAYQIIVKGGGMKIDEFPLRVVRGAGGGVIARLWGVDRQFKRSFQIAGRSGFAGLRMRLTGERFPLRSFDGPDLAKELMKPESEQVFYAAAAELVPGMIVKRLSYLFGKL